MSGPGEDVVRVAPNEMRDHARAGVDLAQAAAVQPDGEHASGPPIWLGAPAMQEDRAPAVGRHQEMVEPVFAGAKPTAPDWDLHDVLKGHEQLGCAGFQIDALNANVGGGCTVGPGIGQTGVAVTRTQVIDAPKIGGYGVSAHGAE
jgi:hypothetical protein